MRRRRVLLVLIGVTLIVPAAVLTWCLTRPQPVLNKETYERIHRGMTLAEVEAIIGAPPGSYGGDDPSAYGITACQGWICSLFHDWKYGKPSIPLDVIQQKLDEGRIVVWTGPDCAIAVQLDGQDRVVGTGYGYNGREPSWWQRMLAEVGLRS